jgi:hypothetical protein
MLPVGIYRACRFSDMSGEGGRGHTAIRAPRSRRDKDVSDDKAIKKTNQNLQTGEENTFFPHTKTLICRVVGKNNRNNSVNG